MREKVFGFAPTEYSILDKYTEELAPFFKLWNMVSDFHNSSNDWLNGDFKELDSAKIDEDVTELADVGLRPADWSATTPSAARMETVAVHP